MRRRYKQQQTNVVVEGADESRYFLGVQVTLLLTCLSCNDTCHAHAAPVAVVQVVCACMLALTGHRAASKKNP